MLEKRGYIAWRDLGICEASPILVSHEEFIVGRERRPPYQWPPEDSGPSLTMLDHS